MKPVVDEMIDMKKTNEAENQKYQEQFMEQTSVPDHVDRFRNIANYCKILHGLLYHRQELCKRHCIRT